MENSSGRHDSLINQHEGRCSIRVRWLVGSLERSIDAAHRACYGPGSLVVVALGKLGFF
jgi:hypothetical protein